MNKYLIKIASTKKTEKPVDKPHTIESAKLLEENDGQLIHWTTGAGKSRRYLQEVEKALKTSKAHERALIIVPASLTTNVHNEIKKHKLDIDESRLDVRSYEKAVIDSKLLRKNKYAIVVADEAQKLRGVGTKRNKELTDILQGGKKRILATATANYNAPSDIAPLLNIVAGTKVLPEDPKHFDAAFLKEVHRPRTLWEQALGVRPEPTIELQNTKYLKQLFKKHVHFYDNKDDPTAKDKFPTVSEKIVNVEMSPEQERMYKFSENSLPFLIKMKIRHGIPLDKREKAEANAFSSGIRQTSNSYRHLSNDPESVKFTPKVEALVSSLKEKMAKNKEHKSLIYSNYLSAGVEEVSRKLTQEKIPHSTYTGNLSREEKDLLVKDYNSGKVPTLLVSSSGAEGLDLKGTRSVHVLENHWNPSKIRQVVGRAARYESHEALSPENRHVDVEHYRSVYAKPIFGKAPMTIDTYMAEHSDDKAAIFGKLKRLMKESTQENRDE